MIEQLDHIHWCGDCRGAANITITLVDKLADRRQTVTSYSCSRSPQTTAAPISSITTGPGTVRDRDLHLSANFAGNEPISYAVTDGTDVVNLTLTVPVAIGSM